jgi:putative hydrolase of the HAD superfamily
LPSNTQNIFQILEKKKIKHIIFDLGGVIVNLDTQRTIDKFAGLSGKSVHEIADYAVNHQLFQDYEKGLIGNASFRRDLKRLLATEHDNSILDIAWNAMIIDVPKERLEWLRHLKQHYRVTILSNTNDIHISYLHDLLKEHHGLDDFSTLVHRVYYSHDVKMRKPDFEIYQHVLDNESYLPEETLFLDDNEQNIKEASVLGIRTIRVLNPQDIPTLLENEGIRL